MKRGKNIVVISVLIVSMFITMSAVYGQNNSSSINKIIDKFIYYLRNRNFSGMKKVISNSYTERNVINFMSENKVQKLTGEVKKIDRISHDTVKVYAYYDIKFRTKLGAINETADDIYFRLKMKNQKWYIEETNFIKDIKTSQKIMNVLMFIYFLIIFPFLLYLNYWRLDLETKEKRIWSVIIIVLNIIGLIIFYFKVMRKKT